jgi:hypothetical protein
MIAAPPRKKSLISGSMRTVADLLSAGDMGEAYTNG